MLGAFVDVELDVLAEALQIALQLTDGVHLEEVIIVGVVAEDGGLDVRVVCLSHREDAVVDDAGADVRI